jgi:hypothetical protein
MLRKYFPPGYACKGTKDPASDRLTRQKCKKKIVDWMFVKMIILEILRDTEELKTVLKNKESGYQARIEHGSISLD